MSARAPVDHDRIQQLARRVRWLDRYRRGIAVVTAMIAVVILMEQLADVLGADWPRFHSTVLAVMLAVIGWWMIEVGLAWITAMWETECDRLIRDRGLPRAELLPERRRGWLRK
jgi:hypothetical protein